MHRGQLQHVILEVGRRFELDVFYIVGSAAILAVLRDPPVGALTATRDVDIIPPSDDPVLMDQIDFVLGEASDFDVEYGYYAQGVGSRTVKFAPGDWKQRTIPVHVEEGRYTGLCMEPHDLVLSKLGAGREKELDFARAVAALRLIDPETLRARLRHVDCTPEERALIAARIEAISVP